MPPRRVVCSLSCRAALGAKGRIGWRRKRNTQAAGPRPPSRAPQVRESAADVMAALDAAVAMECAPPWVRHPEPWTDVVVRRGARA